MRKCEVPDCGRKHAAHGLCLMHYKRMRSHGTTDPQPKRVSPTCEHCDRPAIARGWCERHYRQWQDRGDPTYSDRRRAALDPIVVNQWGYLQRRGKKSIENGHRLIHREVTDAKPGEHVHHINGIKADNRRENLWVCSHGEHLTAHSSLQDAAFAAVRSGLIVFEGGMYRISEDSATTAC